MSLLDKFFGKGAKNDLALDKDGIAAMLKSSPEALAAFESAYQVKVLANEDPTDPLHADARSAKDTFRDVDGEQPLSQSDMDHAASAIAQIVDELMAKTKVWSFDGDLSAQAALPVSHVSKALDGDFPPAEGLVKSIPACIRPQLTADAAVCDIPGETTASLLSLYKDVVDETLPKARRRDAYNRFRQGLDILDLDAVSYEMLGMNRNSIGHWLPQLVAAARGKGFFKVPATKIAKVPLTVLQMSRLDYSRLTPSTKAIVNRWAFQAFGLDEGKDYFVKTGTYSSKFDFRNAHVTGPKEVRELGEYLLYIQSQASMMAGPLGQPSIYGMSTTNEWCVREFVRDKENNPAIYKGLPLHTEYRVFVDCGAKSVLGVTPYWEPETMKKRFGHESDADSPHQMHDYIIYKAHEETLMARYHENVDKVVSEIARLLPDLRLEGQWSIDVMQNGNEFWLIDMALAETSAFYKECVPEALRRPMPEDWLPRLPKTEAERVRVHGSLSGKSSERELPVVEDGQPEAQEGLDKEP